MTTQPEAAVGSETPVSEPTLEEVLAQHLDEPEEVTDEVATEEVAAEDAELTDEEAEAVELPPIDLPSSWKAEEKERWDALPRDTQEYLTQRESQREKFVQSKAQEAAQAKRQAETQALTFMQQHYEQTAQKLQQFEQQFAVPQPDPSLLVTDPHSYAQQLQAYQYYTAQREQAQREAGQAQQQAQYAEQQLLQREQEEFYNELSEKLPEFFDAERGPDLQKKLTATAAELGYPPELIQSARPVDILAMQKVATALEKASKYDALMASRMQKVRDAKSKPNMAVPGAARTEGTAQREKNAAVNALRGGGDAELNAYLKTLI